MHELVDALRAPMSEFIQMTEILSNGLRRSLVRCDAVLEKINIGITFPLVEAVNGTALVVRMGIYRRVNEVLLERYETFHSV